MRCRPEHSMQHCGPWTTAPDHSTEIGNLFAKQHFTKRSIPPPSSPRWPGRKIVELEPKATFFSQGDAADTVFYLQRGRAKLTVVSQTGKKRPSRCLTPAILSVKNAWPRFRPAPFDSRSRE